MNVLIVSQYFWPESFRINDLAIALLERGHKVTVLTGKPNYPQGKIYEGYSFWGYKKESYNGVEVIRVPLIPRGNSSGLRLAINYFSFVFFACLYVLFHNKKYNVSLTFAISPITQIYPALLHKRLHKSKAFLWVQDLWPESVSVAGKMDSSTVNKLLTKMVKSIYKKVDKICVQSKAFIPSVKEICNDDSKICYIPNWAEDLFLDKKLIDKDKYTNLIPKGFIVMFAGNIGESQDFDNIVQAATQTKAYPEIKWVVIGDGRKRKDVEAAIEENDLTNTFYLLGRYPVDEMPSFFTHADLQLVSLKDEYIFSLTIPSKIQSYMAFGKPIVSMINGIGNIIIQEADCGYTAKAGDYAELANNVIKAYKTHKEELITKGQNGKAYYNRAFAKNNILEKLELLFKESLEK